MRKWISVAALTALLCFSASAFWQSRDSNYNINITGGGGGCSHSTETCAWSAQVVSNGGSTPSSTQLNLVDTFVSCVKASSNIGPALNSVLIAFYPLANADNASAQATTSIVNPGSAATINGSGGSFVNGYTGHIAGSAFLNTGFISGSGFTQTSAAYGLYIKTPRSVATTIIDMGAYDGTNISQLLPIGGVTNSLGFINSTGSNNTISNASAAGFFIQTRNGGTSTQYQYTAATPASNSGAVTGNLVATFPFYISARNNQGTADQFAEDQLLAAFFSSGISSTAMGNDLAACTNGMLTTLGLNVW